MTILPESVSGREMTKNGPNPERKHDLVLGENYRITRGTQVQAGTIGGTHARTLTYVGQMMPERYAFFDRALGPCEDGSIELLVVGEKDMMPVEKGRIGFKDGYHIGSWDVTPTAQEY